MRASNSDSLDRLDSNVVIGAGRPMRAGSRMLYQRLISAPSSLTAHAPEQRTRSGVIARSKWVNACWMSLKGCGLIAAARNDVRTNAPGAVAVADSGRQQR